MLETGKEGQGPLATAIAVGRTMGALAVFMAAITVILVEGIMVVIEGYLKRRYEQGREEERRAWREWDLRRREAALRGEDFNEPTPEEKEAARQAE